MPGFQIRDATPADAAACADIYAPFVRDTATSFELKPPTAAAMATRIEAAVEAYAWLVLMDGSDVVGYAYGSQFAARHAYQWSCETSIYLAPIARGKGAGRLLYDALLSRLADRGFRQAVTKMTLPNEASERLHAAAGFEHTGLLRQIGWKLGTWHDVAIMQRGMGGPADAPPGQLGPTAAVSSRPSP